LNFELVAEGVETCEQHAFLYKHGCETYQGYLFSKPLTINDLTAFLAERAAGVQPVIAAAT